MRVWTRGVVMRLCGTLSGCNDVLWLQVTSTWWRYCWSPRLTRRSRWAASLRWTSPGTSVTTVLPSFCSTSRLLNLSFSSAKEAEHCLFCSLFTRIAHHGWQSTFVILFSQFCTVSPVYPRSVAFTIQFPTNKTFCIFVSEFVCLLCCCDLAVFRRETDVCSSWVRRLWSISSRKDLCVMFLTRSKCIF